MARTAIFLRLRIVAGRKGANCGPESQQISCGAAPFRFADEGKESAIAKKAARKPRFLFSQRGVVWSCNKKVDYLGGVQDISFHVKQDAASESGFFGAVGTLIGNFERQGCRCSPTLIEGSPFMEGV